MTPLRVGALLGILFAAARISGLPEIERVAARALDTRLAARGTKAPGSEVAIVAIDNSSLDVVGRWPWSRSTLAKLLDRVAEAEPAVIGFDMIQSESSDDDAALVDSVRRAKNAVLGYYFDFDHNDAASLSTRFAAYNLVLGNPGDTAGVTLPLGTSIRHNRPELTAAARDLGYFNFVPDEDGSYRRVPLAIRSQDRFAVPLSLAMLRLFRPDWNLGLRFDGTNLESVQLGPTTIPVAENGRLLINYRGPGNTFPHISAGDILSGKVAPDVMRGKILLIGVTATAVADVRVTPLDGLMPGVEIHANIMDSILRGDFLWSSRAHVALIEALLIFLLSLSLGLSLNFARGMGGFVVAGLFAAAFLALSQGVFVVTGLPLSTIFPLLAIGMTYGGVTLQHYIVEERAKRRTREAFELYVAPAVAREVSNNPELLALFGDTRELTVMFLDVRGFTSISERMREQPKELVALLNAFLDAMTHVIFDHDGTVDKYVGDEIMAFWGAPLPQPDHAERACRTALDLLDRLALLNQEFVKRGWPALSIGIGIHSGPMVVGNMGSSRRLCYTVVGDNVNLAARLEGLNRKYGTHIIASADTIHAADVIAREIDVVRVHGKDQAVHVFEIVDRTENNERWLPVLEAFQHGIGHYRGRRWPEAVTCFEEILAANPQDAPAQLYLDRIAWFQKNPPPADWDGVTVMETK